MAVKKKLSQETITLVLPIPLFNLTAKFNNRIVVPDTALDPKYKECLLNCKTHADVDIVTSGTWVTSDGHKVKAKFISTCNNRDGGYDEQLNRLCEECYGEGHDYRELKSLWYRKTFSYEDYWHYIELAEV